MDPYVIGPGNSRGIDTQRGVAYFSGDGEVRAVTDYAYVQPGGTISIAVLANDIGNSLEVTNAVINGFPQGSVSFTSTHVIYDTLDDFDHFTPGSHSTLVLTYTIQGDGGTSNGSIFVRVESPPLMWADEDGTLLADEDNRALES